MAIPCLTRCADVDIYSLTVAETDLQLVKARLILMLHQVALNILRHLMGRNRVHGIHEAHHNTLIPGLDIDEGVEITRTGIGLQQTIVGLHHRISIRDVLWIFWVLVGVCILRIGHMRQRRNIIEVEVIRWLTAIWSRHHHIDRLHKLDVRACVANVLMATHPLLQLVQSRQYRGIVEDSLHWIFIRIKTDIRPHHTIAIIIIGIANTVRQRCLLRAHRDVHRDYPRHNVTETLQLMNGRDIRWPAINHHFLFTEEATEHKVILKGGT